MRLLSLGEYYAFLLVVVRLFDFLWDPTLVLPTFLLQCLRCIRGRPLYFRFIETLVNTM